MSKKLFSWVVTGAVTAATIAACGSDDRSGFGTDDPDGGSSGSTSSGGGSSSSGPIGSSSSGGTDDGGLGQCGVETKAAAQLSVDILVMLDASGSMMEQTGANANGPTKWASVKDALKGFINDPKSAGLGVGLQIFPIKHPGAPATCTSNAQCNVGGAQLGRCFLKACVPPNANTPLQSCDTSADCPGNAPCRAYGECTAGPVVVGNCLVGDPTYSCLIGSCKAVTTATCDGIECVEADYKPAKVAVATLPGNAGPLITTIDTIPNPPPENLTPTRIAVKTGIDLAKAHLAANPTHKVVHVLATDGLPTTCGPTDNASIAAIAKTGADQGINTFVIGVFADAQKAQGQATTDAIAASGGTGKAFIISSGANVTADFQKALDAIRGSALPCEYEIPKSTKGEQDFSKVNVQRTSGGKSEVLPNKKGAQDCGTGPGWYYDKDPAAGTPTKIILCPNTCDAVKKDTTGGAKLDILLGCKTVVK